MLKIPKKPSKCPVCQSSKITMNGLGDMSCKKCGYERLSETTRLKNEQMANNNKQEG